MSACDDHPPVLVVGLYPRSTTRSPARSLRRLTLADRRSRFNPAASPTATTLPVWTYRPARPRGHGAALCALVGTGTFADLREAANATTETGHEYEPDEDAKKAYDDLYPRWRAMNDHLLEAAEKGLAPPLWTGAGA